MPILRVPVRTATCALSNGQEIRCAVMHLDDWKELVRRAKVACVEAGGQPEECLTE